MQNNLIDLYNMTAEEIYHYLEKANISCGDLIVHDEDSDTNGLLGRPGQYISKVNFNDLHIPSDDPPCTIEVFSNLQDATKRKAYIEDTIEKNPQLVKKQYFYLKGYAILRLPFQLSPRHAKKYEAVLNDLLSGTDPTDKFEIEIIDPGTVRPYVDAGKYQSTTTHTITFSFGDDDEKDVKKSKKAEPIVLSTLYEFGEFSYYAPKGWLFNQTKGGNYHYAKEIGSFDGGYIYCAKLPLGKLQSIAFKRSKPSEAFKNMIEGMRKNGAFVDIESRIEEFVFYEKPAVKFLATVLLQGEELLAQHFIIASDDCIYSFVFLLENYTDEDYKKFLNEFIVSLSIEHSKSSIQGKLNFIKNKLGK